MKKPSFKERIRYRFDNRMARGSLSLVRLLLITTLIIVAVIGLLLFATGYDSPGLSFWDTLSTVINAWMPETDGEDTIVIHLILKSVAAIVGLLLTSVLIGIIASTIEEKIYSLRKGNSTVLESGHIVVLGFVPGEFSLLSQLILAEGDNRACIVVAEDMERDEMEQEIRDNLEYGRNIRFICRRINITDPTALEKCAVKDARSVIISPSDDSRTVKALLALSSLIDNTDNVRISAVVNNRKFKFPRTEADRHNITTLNTGEITGRIIAHTCTQTGLSSAISSILNFEGAEFYSVDLPDAAGSSFLEITCRMDRGIPLGIISGDHIEVNPSPDTVINSGEGILVLSESKNDAYLSEATAVPDPPAFNVSSDDSGSCSIALIGFNKLTRLILKELPKNIDDLIFVGLNDNEKDLADAVLRTVPEIPVSFCDDDLSVESNLKALCERTDHFVILSDYNKDENTSDMDAISKILHLRDIREQYGLKFNITAEMYHENNQRLITRNDNVDYIVASDLSSLFLTQIAENPELIDVFNELLSNEGSEFYLRSASALNCTGNMSVRELRHKCLSRGCIVLGINRSSEDGMYSEFSLNINDSVSLSESDDLIVISEI